MINYSKKPDKGTKILEPSAYYIASQTIPESIIKEAERLANCSDQLTSIILDHSKSVYSYKVVLYSKHILHDTVLIVIPENLAVYNDNVIV